MKVNNNKDDDAGGLRRSRLKAQRPKSLAEVSSRGLESGMIDAALREFLDTFYLEKDPASRAEMLAETPALHVNERVNAYLAAVAEHLAFHQNLSIPKWTADKSRFLRRPYFPCGLESLKATLIKESPAAFRRRMIFVGADPLYRPRKDSSGIRG